MSEIQRQIQRLKFQPIEIKVHSFTKFGMQRKHLRCATRSFMKTLVTNDLLMADFHLDSLVL